MTLLRIACFAFIAVGALHAQVAVKHIQPNEKSPTAAAVWAGDTLYLGGLTADPVAPGVYGDTKAQSFSILTKIQALLKAQGLDMKDVVKMTVFLVGDPDKGSKLDFAGLQESYSRFFGTETQPNKPARSAMQVVALPSPWALVEIEAIAVRSK